MWRNDPDKRPYSGSGPSCVIFICKVLFGSQSWSEGRRTAACRVRRLMQSKDYLRPHLLQEREWWSGASGGYAGGNPGELMRRWSDVSEGEISDAARPGSSRVPPLRYVGAWLLICESFCGSGHEQFLLSPWRRFSPDLCAFLWNVFMTRFCFFNRRQCFPTVRDFRKISGQRSFSSSCVFFVVLNTVYSC